MIQKKESCIQEEVTADYDTATAGSFEQYMLHKVKIYLHWIKHVTAS